jgi:hypothetical protein
MNKPLSAFAEIYDHYQIAALSFALSGPRAAAHAISNKHALPSYHM